MAEKRVSVRLVVEGGRVMRAELDDVGDDGERAFRRIDRAADGASAMIGRVAGLFAAGFSLNALNDAAQRWTEMGNALRVMGMDQAQVETTLDRLSEIALRTHQPLQETVQLYQRIRLSADELGAGEDDLFQFVQTTSLALAAQGGSAQQASGALLQLSQAMGAGVVRAEEFNSILEGAPALAQAAAAGFGVSVGRLRTMVVEGEVTSQAFFAALNSQSAALEQAFGNAEVTVGQALTDMGTEFTRFVGRMDEMAGVSDGVVAGIQVLTQNLDGMAAIAVGLAATQLPALVSGLRAVALASSLAAGPWGLVIGMVAAGVTYFGLFRDRAQELPPELLAAQEAQDQLSAALTRFATDASPQAREEVVQHAADLIVLKEAALDAAAAELALMEAELARFANAPIEQRGLLGDLEENNMREEVEAARESVSGLRDEIARLRETAADPEAAAAQLDIVRTVTTQTEIAIDATDNLGRSSREAAEEALTGWAAVTDQLSTYAVEAGDTASQIGDVMTGSMKRLEDAVLSAFQGSTEGARAFFAYIAEELARVAIRESIISPASNWLSNLISGAGNSGTSGGGLFSFLARLFHNGGDVGIGGTPRAVSPAVFAAAPRMHSGGIAGLAPDEVPAILQRGERVQSLAEVAGGGGVSRAVIDVNLADGLSAEQEGQVLQLAHGVSLRVMGQGMRQQRDALQGQLNDMNARGR